MVAGRWNLLWCWLEVTETDRPGSYALLFTFYWKARIVIYQMIYFSPYVDNSMVSFSDFLCILLFSSLKRKGIFCFKNTLSTYYHILTKILFSRRRKKRNIWKTVSSLVSFTRVLTKKHEGVWKLTRQNKMKHLLRKLCIWKNIQCDRKV